MKDRRTVDELSIDELELILAIRKREKRMQRIRRMADNGRLFDCSLPNLEMSSPLSETPPESIGTGDTIPPLADDQESIETPPTTFISTIRKWLSGIDAARITNHLLALIEVAAVIGLIWLLWDSWQTRKELNREVAQAQHEAIEQDFPTPSPTPPISLVLLPGGHTSPISDAGASPGEAAGIPEHLLPLVSAYTPPPIPTPGPEQARRISIPAIRVDHPIVQGDDWEQLKKGVGQHIGSVHPGTTGNLVLTAHNDIYGEIFKRLDELKRGDKVTIYTASRQYIYEVQNTRIVEPTDVSVLESTRKATITLISCYPYLVDTQRIIVVATLIEEF